MIVSVTMESPVPSAITRMVVNKKEGREGKVFLWLDSIFLSMYFFHIQIPLLDALLAFLLILTATLNRRDCYFHLQMRKLNHFYTPQTNTLTTILPLKERNIKNQMAQRKLFLWPHNPSLQATGLAFVPPPFFTKHFTDFVSWRGSQSSPLTWRHYTQLQLLEPNPSRPLYYWTQTTMCLGSVTFECTTSLNI